MSKGLKIANKIAAIHSKHAAKGSKLSDDEIDQIDSPEEEATESPDEEHAEEAGAPKDKKAQMKAMHAKAKMKK